VSHAQGAASETSESKSAEAGASQTDTDSTDVIVVTGIRRTIEKSLHDKRVADTVSDVITAEDIGKLPDNNVAETLSRVSGVQITRRDGDGSTFAVRGISQNLLQINGRTFIGPSESGQPALEGLNPEILSGLDVIKSPSADLAEGALGAIVNLRTKRPLELADFVVSGRAEGADTSQGKKLGYRTSGLVSKQFLGGTFGALVSAAYADTTNRGYLFDTVGWTRTNAIDVTGDGVPDANMFRPNRLMETVVDRRDKRLTLNGAIQYKPTDHFEALFEGTYSDLKRARDLSQYQGLLNNNATNATADSNGTITSADFSSITLRPLVYDVPTEFKTLNLGETVKWSTDDDRFGLSSDISYSRGTGLDGTPGAAFTYVVVPRAGRTVNASYDLMSGSRNVPNMSYAGNYNLNDPSNYQLLSIFDGEAPRRNTNFDTRGDTFFKVAFGPLSKLEAGVRYTRTSLVSSNVQNLPTAASLLAGHDTNGDGILTPDELPGLVYDNHQSGSYYSGVDGTYPRSFLTGSNSKDAGRAAFGLPEPTTDTVAGGRVSIRDVLQKTWAGYVKADVEGSNYRGNIGLRYTSTSRVSSGFLSATQPTSAAARFGNWLPSANLAIDLAPQLLVRFAAAKVVAQPAVADVGVGFAPNTTNNTGSRGNPALRPFKANQYDATIEWYFAPASLLSAALFRKDVSSFTVLTVTQEFVPGFSERFGPFNISQPQNGSSGKVQGFELNYQHAFRFLPGLLQNLGVQTNYTYADSTTPIVDGLTGRTLPLPNLSKNSYSLIGYYDDGRFSARAAYSWRSEALVLVQQAVNGGSRYNNAYGQLDASVAFNLNKNFRLTAEAQNLTKAINRQFDGVDERLDNSALEDRRFYFGVGFTF
jgi:TonB-dependent receptor